MTSTDLGQLEGGSESLLQGFNGVLRRVHGAAEVLGDESLRKRSATLLRQTVTAQMIGERVLIAVAGPQGAGKSTLVRHLYDIPEEWLPIGLGIGEQMPVMIVEVEGLLEPRGFSVDIGAPDEYLSSILTSTPQEPSAWISGIRGARRQQVAALLEVPATFFSVSGTGFLLLPGYNMGDDPASAWTPLMRTSLQLAAGAVIVTDRSRLAGNQQIKALRDFQRTAMADQLPVVVVSKTEGASDAQRAELREVACQAFELPDDRAESQIVLTGTGGDYVDTWVPLLRNALVQYAGFGPRISRLQMTALQTLIENDAQEVLNDLKLLIAEDKIATRIAPYNTTLDHFDTAARDLRRTYLAALDEALVEQTGEASPRMRDWLKENAEGYTGGWHRLWATVTLQKGALIDELDEALVAAWTGPTSQDTFQSKHEGVIDDSIRHGILIVNGYLPTPASDEPRELESAHDTDEPEGPAEPLDRLVSGLGVLGEGPPPGSVDVLPPDPASVALIPVLALEFMRLSKFQIDTGRDLSQFTEADWAGTLGQMTVQRRLLLTAAVAFIGGDALGGQLDSVNGMAQALTSVFTGHAATAGVAAAAAPVAAPAAVAAGVVLAAVSAAVVLKFMNEANLKRREEADIAIRKVSETHKAQLTHAYDGSIVRLREILEARLRLMFHVDELTHRRWILGKLVEDLTLARLELLDRIRADASSLE